MVLIFDLTTYEQSKYSVPPPKTASSAKVTDIKCHPDKMHRLLISYEQTGICVYSINKDRALFTHLLSADKDFHKGKVLAVEWVSDNQIVVGFSSGTLEVWNVETPTKPTMLNFDHPNLITMRIAKYDRMDGVQLIVQV